MVFRTSSRSSLVSLGALAPAFLGLLLLLTLPVVGALPELLPLLYILGVNLFSLLIVGARIWSKRVSDRGWTHFNLVLLAIPWGLFPLSLSSQAETAGYLASGLGIFCLALSGSIILRGDRYFRDTLLFTMLFPAGGCLFSFATPTGAILGLFLVGGAVGLRATFEVFDTSRRSIGTLSRKVERFQGSIEAHEEKLLQQREQLKKHAMIISRTDNAVIICDKNGLIEWVNDGFTRITGFASEEVVGKSPGSMLHGPDTDQDTIAFMRRRLRSQQGFKTEVVNYSKHGRRYWISIEVQPVFNEKGELTNFMAIESDVTRQKEFEAELRSYVKQVEESRDRIAEQAVRLTQQAEDLSSARDLAEAAAQAKSAFLANVSHEIRSPLASILGFAEALKEGRLEETEQGEALDTMLSNGQQLLSVINDVLDLSKIEAGRLSVEYTRFSPADLARELESSFRYEASRRDIGFRVELRYPLPETIECDRSRLRQVLVNLITNALKFTAKGEVLIRIRAELLLERIYFDVTDTGQGIAYEQLGRIFEPFEQGDTSNTRRHSGTGLGLAICRELTEILRGQITAHSVPGRGSVFSVVIPTGPLDDVATLSSERVSRGATPLGAINEDKTIPASVKYEGTVLVADDNPSIQRLLQLLLSKLGVRVISANNGQEALETALSRDQIDLVFMDMQMPVMDGYQAVRELRSKGFTKPIIAVTANAMEHQARNCIAAGCDQHVGKPFQQADIQELLEHYLRADRENGKSARASRAKESSGADFDPELLEDPAYLELVGDFVRGLGTRVGAIEQAYQMSDFEEVARLAHNLKSSGLFGYEELSTLGAKLEQTARDCRNAEIQGVIATLKDASQQIQKKALH